jgi:hypothetical protein
VPTIRRTSPSVSLLIVGVQQPGPGAHVRLDLVVRVPEHLFPSRRVDHSAGFEIPVPHALLRCGKGERQPLFAFAQRGLGALARGDVTDDHLDGAPISIEQRARDLDVRQASVEADDPLFGHRHRVAGEQASDALANLRMEVLMKQGEGGSPQQVVRPCRAKQADARRVDEHDAGVLTDEDPIGGQLHQAPIALGLVLHVGALY